MKTEIISATAAQILAVKSHPANKRPIRYVPSTGKSLGIDGIAPKLDVLTGNPDLSVWYAERLKGGKLDLAHPLSLRGNGRTGTLQNIINDTEHPGVDEQARTNILAAIDRGEWRVIVVSDATELELVGIASDDDARKVPWSDLTRQQQYEHLRTLTKTNDEACRMIGLSGNSTQQFENVRQAPVELRQAWENGFTVKGAPKITYPALQSIMKAFRDQQARGGNRLKLEGEALALLEKAKLGKSLTRTVMSEKDLKPLADKLSEVGNNGKVFARLVNLIRGIDPESGSSLTLEARAKAVVTFIGMIGKMEVPMRAAARKTSK